MAPPVTIRAHCVRLMFSLLPLTSVVLLYCTVNIFSIWKKRGNDKGNDERRGGFQDVMPDARQARMPRDITHSARSTKFMLKWQVIKHIY
jgi:hypothetical protein